MPREYRTIPGGDSAHNIDIQSFELETAHSRHNEFSVRQKLVLTFFACLFALLLLVVGYGAHKGGEGNYSSTEVPAAQFKGDQPEIEMLKVEAASEAPIGRQNEKEGGMPITQSEPKMIFCYGDSLTYGKAPPSREAYPYSKYLMQELNLLFGPVVESESQMQISATVVQHAGFPGWTSSQMLNHIYGDQGICSIIARNPTLSLLIILTGTDDMAGVTNSEKSVATTIMESIVDLHKGAISCAGGESNSRFHTLAIGIPEKEKAHVASQITSYTNYGLKQFAASSIGGRVSYVEFPFQYHDGDTKWSVDGLHLSKEGYEELGRQLAPEVKIILDSIDS